MVKKQLKTKKKNRVRKLRRRCTTVFSDIFSDTKINYYKKFIAKRGKTVLLLFRINSVFHMPFCMCVCVCFRISDY